MPGEDHPSCGSRAQASPANAERLLQILEPQIEQLQAIVDAGEAQPMQRIARFVWGLLREIWRVGGPGTARSQAKGLLKEVAVFEAFNPASFTPSVLAPACEPELQVLVVLRRYQHFLKTGEVTTFHPRPHVIGETDLVMFVAKPAGFTCSYGGGGDEPPAVSSAVGPTALLNLAKQKPQIHEWIARRFHDSFETAKRTYDFWAEKAEKLACVCQECETCASYISGCVNRLDIDTSGVLLVAKRAGVFAPLRQAIGNKEGSGAEKHYLALTHGQMMVETPSDRPGWGVIEGYMKFDPVKRKSVPWTDEDEEEMKRPGVEAKGRDDGGKLFAKSVYRPLIHFTSNLPAGSERQHYTLVHLQIYTGRRHQIRYHCSLRGHPLVGDGRYWDAKYPGTPETERVWASRCFLHSYFTQVREPGTGRTLRAVAPLPKDFCKVMIALLREGSAEACCEPRPDLLTRERHEELESSSLFMFRKGQDGRLFTILRSEDEEEPAPAAPQRPSFPGTPMEELPSWGTQPAAAKPRAEDQDLPSLDTQLVGAKRPAEEEPSTEAPCFSNTSSAPLRLRGAVKNDGWRLETSKRYKKEYFANDLIGESWWPPAKLLDNLPALLAAKASHATCSREAATAPPEAAQPPLDRGAECGPKPSAVVAAVSAQAAPLSSEGSLQKPWWLEAIPAPMTHQDLQEVWRRCLEKSTGGEKASASSMIPHTPVLHCPPLEAPSDSAVSRTPPLGAPSDSAVSRTPPRKKEPSPRTPSKHASAATCSSRGLLAPRAGTLKDQAINEIGRRFAEVSHTCAHLILPAAMETLANAMLESSLPSQHSINETCRPFEKDIVIDIDSD